MKGIFSLPATILMMSFVGFSAFAFESGVTRGEAGFMTMVVWALPAKMILIGSVAGGANLAASFIAVTLSSVRMMPMVASLMPDLKTSKTPTWVMLFMSHFVAITAWVFATHHVNKVPREGRVAWFIGFGMTLTVVNAIIVVICYGLVASFPPLLAGALFFMTPMYFVTSIWATARQNVVRIAFVVGIVCGPLFALIEPEFDILYAGVGGGTLAWAIDRYVFRRRSGSSAGAAQ